MPHSLEEELRWEVCRSWQGGHRMQQEPQEEERHSLEEEEVCRSWQGGHRMQQEELLRPKMTFWGWAFGTFGELFKFNAGAATRAEQAMDNAGSSIITICTHNRGDAGRMHAATTKRRHMWPRRLQLRAGSPV